MITITSVEDQIKVRGLAKSNSFLFSVASGSFLGQIQNSRYGISERKGDWMTHWQEDIFSHRNKGNIPHWCKNPSPVVTSSTNRTSTANIAALPFHVSALFVQPHSQTITGGGSSLRCESYAANSSSTLPNGTKDCKPNARLVRL